MTRSSMAKSSMAGGSKATGKRKAMAEELIDVNNIQPVSYSIQTRATDSTSRVRQEFKKACGKRVVIVERLFDEDFLLEIDFPYLATLKEWNMWDLFVNKNKVLTNVVKVFYFRGDTNIYETQPNEEPEMPDVEVAVRETERSFRTRIYDDVIDVDEAFIRRYIHDIPNDSPVEVPDEKSFPYLLAFREILGDNDLNSTKEVKAEGMDLHNRILHLMVCQVLFPRCGDYSKARKRDIYWMYRIIKRERINVSGMVMTRMMEGMRNSKTSGNPYALPYGRLVSRICSERYVINPNEPTTRPQFKSPFNKRSLDSLGWKFDENLNRYVRKKERQTETQASTSTNPLEAVLAALNEQGAGLNEIRSLVGNLANRVEEVYRRQDVLSAQNQYIFDVFSWTPNDPQRPDPFPTFPPGGNAP